MQTDLHSHILPAVDDGAADQEQALAMLEIAERDGTGVIAATPHSALARPEVVFERTQELRRLARDRGLSIQIVTGCEVRFDADLAARYAAGELVTINESAWILLELSLRADWSPYLRQGIYDLQVAGASLILAHAERYPAVQRDPDVLLDLIAQGVLIQVNADSITARGSRAAARCAEILVRRRMAHVIASDAHDTVHRPPHLSEAFARARSMTDENFGDWLKAVPGRVVAGEAIHPPDPRPAKGTGFFRRVFSRS